MRSFLFLFLFVYIMCFNLFAGTLTHENFARHIVTYIDSQSSILPNTPIEDVFDFLKNKGVEPVGGFETGKTMSIEESVKILGEFLANNDQTKTDVHKRIDHYVKNRVILIQSKGDLYYKDNENSEWKKVNSDSKFNENGSIKTGEQSWAHLRIGTLGNILLKENSVLELSEMTLIQKNQKEDIHLHLSQGRMVVNVHGMDKQSSLKTSTPSTIVSVRGTIFEITAEDE